MAMTPREVFLRQMNFQGAPRCFHTETGYWEEVYEEYPLFREQGVASSKEAFRLLGLDRIVNLWGEEMGPNTFACPGFEETVLYETAGTVVVANGRGSLEERRKDGKGSVRMFRSAAMTPEEWERLKAERFSPGHPGRKPDLEGFGRRIAGTEDLPLGLYVGSLVGLTRQMLAYDGFVYACYDYPDMVEDMVETNCLLIEGYLDRVLPHFRFDIATIYENITGTGGPLVPVDFYRQVVGPRLRRVADKLRGAGVSLIAVGSDGDVRPLLPIMLDNGVNCLTPYEVKNCAHPGELLDQYRGALRILGGVDKHEIQKGREATNAHLKSLEPWVARGGLVPHIDHDVPPSISQENYLYYLERKRSLFG